MYIVFLIYNAIAHLYYCVNIIFVCTGKPKPVCDSALLQYSLIFTLLQRSGPDILPGACTNLGFWTLKRRDWQFSDFYALNHSFLLPQGTHSIPPPPNPIIMDFFLGFWFVFKKFKHLYLSN